MVGPLPFVRELGLVARLVVGGVHVVHARLQARVHDGEVLVGQRQIDHEVRLDFANQRCDLGRIVGIDLGDLDRRLALLGDLLAGNETARGEADVFEDVRSIAQFRATTSGRLPHRDQDIVHGLNSLLVAGDARVARDSSFGADRRSRAPNATQDGGGLGRRTYVDATGCAVTAVTTTISV